MQLCNLLKANLSLSSHTLEITSCEDFDIRSEAAIPLGTDFLVDTHLDDLKWVSDPSSLLAIVAFLECHTISDTLKGSSLVHDSSLPLASQGEVEEEDRFETDSSFDDQGGILVELEDTFYEGIHFRSLAP